MKKRQISQEGHVILPKGKSRKDVDNETYKKYLNNKDNLLIMKSACKQFHKFIPADELKSCQMVGLWLAIAEYDNRTKFTSYLYNRVRWECLNYMRDSLTPEFSLNVDVSGGEKGSRFAELITILPEIERIVVTKYIIEQKTFKEIGKEMNRSHETARKHFNNAIERLKIHLKSFPT